MIKTLPPHIPEEPFADGIRSRRQIGNLQHSNTRPLRYPIKQGTKLVIMIPNQILWTFAIRRRLAPLLRDPRLTRVTRHAEMHDPARTQLNDEENEHLSEAEIHDRQKVARPDVLGMVL